ncbi:hypothetical protein SPAN111604_11210 [Sphingomonas antarctica]|uniref:caspase family protein n=1 Tax=Sphingomonas antarctica TaxID=2040274 RepID=UPI0039ED312A
MTRLLMALAVLVSTPAAATIRALFVGVNQYRYSHTHNPDGQFEDLKGTVNDVTHIKDALRTAYQLDLDRPDKGCVSRNAVSTTLTDDCATRAALIDELDARIAQSAPGDTLLFYYAGHGATVRDDVEHDQASGYDTTILTTDARQPGADASAEILDRDIGAIIDRATGRGINVVTIFDSCYSESGTRNFGINTPEGRARDAPKLIGTAQSIPLSALPAAGSQAVQGYRVHLAAARESQKARETGQGNAVSGVFTTQLAATLLDLRGATFDDILTETRRKVEEVGQGSQSPRGSGALTARLGGAVSHVTVLDAASDATGVTIFGGRLSGVTVGSRFAVFAGSSQAVSDAAPLATGNVTTVTPATATLSLDSGAPDLPKRLVVRELQHAFGTRALTIRNLAPPADRAFVSKAIADGRVATEAEPAQLMIKQGVHSPTVSLVTVGGQVLADLGLAADPRFSAILAQEAGKVARVNDLIGLRTAPDSAQLAFCISNDMDYDLMSCPPLETGKRRQIFVRQDARLTVRNLTDRKRYVYVFGIDEKFGVDLILPEGAQADPIDVSRPLTTRLPLRPTSAGPYRFVTVATDQPIDAAAFQQSATGARGGNSCANALQRALCAVMQGTRDPDAPKVGDWTAIVTDVDVMGKAPE